MANELAYLLSGVEPIEAFLDRRIASFIGSALSNGNPLLRQIFARQLAVKDIKSRSWVIYAAKRLHRYPLPSLHQLVADPPNPGRW